MSVVSLKKMTEAEEKIIASYDALDDRSETSAAAIHAFKTHGLPNRRVEAWHYTDLRANMRSIPDLAQRPDPENAAALAASYDAAVTTARVPVIQGHVFMDHAFAAPEGISFSATQKTLSSDIPVENTIGIVSQALAGDCLSIQVAHNAKVSEPIGIAHVSGEEATLQVSQHEVVLGNGSQATIIERYTGNPDVAYQNHAVTNLDIGEECNAKYLIVLQNGAEASHLGQLNVSLGKDANLTLFVINAGGKFSRQDLNIHVKGEGADFQLRGVNLIGEGQHIDLTMDLNHAVPNTTSEEIVRNVVVGKGKGIFQGKIRVAQIAQKTDAKMACNTLLLSDEGEFSSKPELEIFADDVACGHGATFADIEPAYMFYLMSRGIPEREARALLIKGFVDEIVEDLDDETIEEALVSMIDGWLDRHG